MSRHDIVVIGASAGGVEALSQIVDGLPASFPAAVFVVVHVPAAFPSRLPEILGRVARLPVIHARDGEAVIPGRIAIAPPDYHLLLQTGTMHLSRGAKEHHTRPAIDPLFRSAAQAYGSRVTGVVLTGTLYDGTGGLLAIKRQGGAAIVQDPNEARFASMPQSAISSDHPDYVLPLSEVAVTLVRLAQESSLPKGTCHDKH